MRRRWIPGLATIAVIMAVTWMSRAGNAAAQERSILVSENVHVSADAPGIVHVEPMIAASPLDSLRLVAASMIVPDPRSETSQVSWGVAVYASRDGGRSWHRRSLPGLDDDDVAGDPWLAWSPEGVLYLSCIVGNSFLEGEPPTTWVFRSTDGGWSWEVNLGTPAEFLRAVSVLRGVMLLQHGMSVSDAARALEYGSADTFRGHLKATLDATATELRGFPVADVVGEARPGA